MFKSFRLISLLSSLIIRSWKDQMMRGWGFNVSLYPCLLSLLSQDSCNNFTLAIVLLFLNLNRTETNVKKFLVFYFSFLTEWSIFFSVATVLFLLSQVVSNIIIESKNINCNLSSTVRLLRFKTCKFNFKMQDKFRRFQKFKILKVILIIFSYDCHSFSSIRTIELIVEREVYNFVCILGGVYIFYNQ